MNRMLIMFPALVLLMLARSARASEGEEPASGEKAAPRVAVAVLTYEGALPGNAELGVQIAEILSSRLSAEDTFEVVERAKLGEILREHQLKLAGMVDQGDAAKVGRLVGARLLVMGKAFLVDKKLMIVTKVVGVETGLLRGSIREVDMNKPMSDTILLLSEDVAGVIKNHGAKLLPKDAQLTDPVVALSEALSKKFLPAVAVVIPESHRTRVVRDPAAETELKKTLIRCGLKVMDTGENNLADWAKAVVKDEKPAWPPGLEKADYVVVGEAFSEFAARTGDLVTCAGRVEINVIDRKTGQVVLADSETDRAVDLAEGIAAKAALQKCGRKLSLRVLKHFADALPNAAKD